MSSTPAMSLLDLENDPRLFLYTSLTAGSSHIVTATSRMETILKANRIPFQAIDVATDERAKRLWQRRSGGRKFPGLVKEGFVIGDLNEVEEWNEYGELKENIGPLPAANATIPKGGQVGVQTAPPSIIKPQAGPALSSSTVTSTPGGLKKGEVVATQGFDKSKGVALPGAEEIKARSEAKKAEILAAPAPEKMGSAPDVKAETIEAAKQAEVQEPTKPDTQEEKKETGIDDKAIKKEIAAETPIRETQESTEDVIPVKGTEPETETNVQESSTTEATKTEESKDNGDVKVNDVEETKDHKPEEKTDEEEVKTEKRPSIAESIPKAEVEEDDDSSGATSTHRGSQVKAVPDEVIKKIESDNALVEVEDEDDAAPTRAVEGSKVGDEEDVAPVKAAEGLKVIEEDDAVPTKAVEGLKVADEQEAKEEETKTQEQSAKDPTDAGESVKD